MLQVKLESFEGPLDLLLHLIDKAEVDIYEISVSEIADQYVAYIRQMQELELEIASEFLVMACTLLAIKSKMLLPKKEEYTFQPMLDMELEEEYDPRLELIERLVQYRKYKQLASLLREEEAKRSQIYTRPAEDLSSFIDRDDINPVANVSLFDLVDALQEVLKKKEEEPLSKVERDEISVSERMKEIKACLERKKEITFDQLFEGKRTKTQIVVTFLALLELIKKNEVYCQQDRLFGKIKISLAMEVYAHGS
ncbi:segregation and condensation protein A [Caldalkalibacillus thermarum]|uniref:segregation and condensation protein A n=1 Tax=Caldalkalibacillus thermarum TaxID=296745 RepID=UPI0016678437|nr:segregation/condensation protein A [Caldalkalibacillus thermarum]GGK15339.1 segregation and condensation protein A [Caldalkalibacillus thermarum]